MGLVAEDDISKIRGIGDKKAALYHKLGIFTVRQLLLHLPRNYIDLTVTRDISKCEAGAFCLVRAEVIRKHAEQRIRKGLSIFKVEVSDGDVLLLTFFNTRFAVEALKTGESYYFYGIMGGTLLKHEMSNPMVIPQRYIGKFMPVYPVCAGISSKVMAQDISAALLSLSQPLCDTLPPDLLADAQMTSLDAAVRALHSPQSRGQYETARDRVAFEELVIFSAVMIKLRSMRSTQRTTPLLRCDMGAFYASLPFSPTGGQKNAIADIESDLCSGLSMNRLVQGDVGSGKTLVAAAAAFMLWKNGYQTALMAPTELLAQQHHKTLNGILGGLGMRVELMTGSMTAKERRELNARIKAGECDIVVGTHALISRSTEFSSLGLVVTDEQHRFGVAQRAGLGAKGERVHTLVMSATPIPRTLSLILYGDLDVSLIKELPPGRTPVATYRIDSPKRSRALGFIRDRINEGRQAYIVCPLVAAADDEGDSAAEATELHAAKEYSAELASGAFEGYSVGLLHGKMRPAEKEKVMADFSSGKIQLLVSTTVVEVGVDVPNATVMMIENAERFGLSQLHQLRGRVGRGKHQSYCILLTDSKSQSTAERLKAIVGTNDGFKIAEEDLRLRGPGDILGARQHGLPGLENADLAANAELFSKAQQAAQQLLRRDPELKEAQNRFVAQAVRQLTAQVGENPN